MKWLMVSRQHHPTHGGIGTYVQRFLHAADESGWHVELMTQPGVNWPPCARVHEVRTSDAGAAFEARLPDLRRRHVVRPYRYALWSKAVAERLLTMRDAFDVIEFVDCQAEGFAAIGCPRVRERHRGARFIVHAHTPMFVEELINGADVRAFNRAMYHDWERRALRSADGVMVTADVLRNAIGEVCDSTVIPYPIAAETPSSDQRRAREMRIVLIGSVQPRKGVDLWARSLNRVLRAKPKATAMLIGPDTSAAPDGLSMAAHVQRLLDPRVIDRFRWMGSLPHEQVCDMVATSNLVIVPSRLESFSFVAAESLLAGTPVLVSDRTGIAEHVPSLPRVDAQDVDALAEAQIQVLSDMATARETAEACRVEMIHACDPTRVLRLREAFIESCGPSPRLHHTAADTLEEVASFISNVDAGVDGAAIAFGDRSTGTDSRTTVSSVRS